MPRPLPRGNGLPPLEAKAPRTILPSDNMPETWLTVPSYNSNIMDPNTGTVGIPWNNLLVFMTSRAAFLSQVNADVTTLKGQMITVQDQVTTLQGQVSSLTGRMTTAEGDITTLQAHMTTANNNIANLQTRMTTTESHVTTLQGDVTTINTTLTSLQSQINTINARLAAAGIP